MIKKPFHSEPGGEPVKAARHHNEEGGARLSAEEIVRAAYRQVLKREVEAVGLEIYATVLTSGTINVDDLIKQLLHSDEWKGRFIEGRSRPQIVAALYDCALARAPDRAAWNQFMAGGANADWGAAIEQLVNSPEYRDRFGTDAVPSDRLRHQRDSLTPCRLVFWDPSFGAIATENDLDFRAVPAKQVEAGKTQAARFLIRMLWEDASLRWRFPRAISEGADGKFFRWVIRNGRAKLGLSDLAIFQIVEAFDRRPDKRIYDLYLNDPALQRFFPLGLLPTGQRDFLSWLTTFGRAIHALTDEEILWFLHVSAEDLMHGLSLTYLLNPVWQERFPLAFTARGWKPFRHWFTSHFSSDFARISPWKAPGVLSRPEQRVLAQPFRRPLPASARTKVGGVNILSHFCYPSGIRQAALATKKSLEGAGVATSCRDVPVDVASKAGTRTDWLGLEIYPITLLTNAPTPHFVTAYERSGLFRQNDVYRIAYWYWELETIPEEWVQLAPLIHEIWAPTEFVAAAMLSRMPVPVYQMAPGVEIGEVERIPRAALGIPEDHCVFLFAFDLHSQIRRKNPHGVIRAFQQAFTPDDKVTLVIKATGGERTPDFAELEQIAHGANVVLIHRLLSRSASLGLIQLCDCFVSLHRSEGFGLGMAEAMLLGKPVIATSYSGNLDFMNSENSMLVDYRRVEITESHGNYTKGNFWADPSIDQAASYMRQVFENRAAAAALGARAQMEMVKTLSLQAAGQRMLDRIQKIMKRP